jgi:integrase/recombinase XerD
MGAVRFERFVLVTRCKSASAWLGVQADRGLAQNTLDAYCRALEDYLSYSDRVGFDVHGAGRSQIAAYVRDLASRPSRRAPNIIRMDSGVGLANATLQQRLTAVRLFYDYLIEEGIRTTNPVGRGRYTPGKAFAGARERGLIPRFRKLPWIPNERQWQAVIAVAQQQPLRNRLMLALSYDAGLRREELCSIEIDDIDPSHRLLRIRAETTKNRQGRVVPYSEDTGRLFAAYLPVRRGFTTERGRLFISQSRRNHGRPLSIWAWSKVVRRMSQDSGVPEFSTHSLRHLCLTDLARAGWDIHEIAKFAGHRSLESTLLYIHLSGRELAAKLDRGMAEIHAWRVKKLSEEKE